MPINSIEYVKKSSLLLETSRFVYMDDGRILPADPGARGGWGISEEPKGHRDVPINVVRSLRYLIEARFIVNHI